MTNCLPPVWRFVGGLYIQYNNRKWNITKDFSLSPLSLCMYNVYLASFFFWFVDWRGFIHQCVMCAGFMYANNAKDIYHTYTSGVWNYKNGAGKNIKFHTARCSVSPFSLCCSYLIQILFYLSFGWWNSCLI